MQMIRRYQSIRVKAVLAAVALPFLAGTASSTSAGERCIRCTAPERTYLCSVRGENVPADERRLGFYCAARIAEDEDHATCAVVRKEKQCQGERRGYVFDATAPVPGALADDAQVPQQEQAAGAAEPEGPPRTVVDLTRETARQTEESLEKAADQTVETTRGIGERVQDAAKGAAGAVEQATRTTIRCLGSLFNDC
jgi:hypothetical protein